MYIIVESYITIKFAILMVSYFTKNSEPNHFIIIDQILKYLAGSENKRIIFTMAN